MDYPPQQQGAILDLLFGPAGLALDMLKLEIGGDGQVIMGSTPAHEHFAGEAVNMHRGSQAWLAQQARLRHPSIVLVALPWSFPAWVGVPGSVFGDCVLSGPCTAASYVADWLVGMRREFGVLVDVVGVLSDAYDAITWPSYVKTLRVRLNSAGLSSVRINCGDGDVGGAWPCADAARLDADLSAAVGIVSGHGIPAAGPYTDLGKPTWWTHVSSNGRPADLLGATVMAGQLQNAAFAGLNSVFVWGALCASYNGLPEHNNGLIRADSPWSGSYFVTPTFYAVAHTSLFAGPGWKTLAPGRGSGPLSRGGEYVMRYDGAATWSLVITKFTTSNEGNGLIEPEYATFKLGPLWASSTVAYVYATNFGSSASGNASFLVNTQNVSISPGDGIFSLWLDLNCLYTVTNAPAAPLSALVPSPPSTPFPSTYRDSFALAGRPAGSPVAFVVDINGAFELVSSPAEGLQQTAAAKPFTRYGTDTAPHAIVGNQQVTDVDVSVSVFFPSASDSAMLGVRCSGLHDTSNNGVTGMDNLPGIWLSVGASDFQVVNRLDAGAVVLRAGTLPIALDPATWTLLRLVVRGDRVVASVGTALVASFNVSRWSTPPAGFVGLGARAFGHQPIFRNLAMLAEASVCSARPAPNASVYIEACSAGTAGQSFSLMTEGGGTYQIFSSAASLCLQADGSASADYRYPRMRRVYLAVCDAASKLQQFSVEATVRDGLYSYGPIQASDGRVLAAYGDSDADDTEVAAFPWQGGSNAMYAFVDDGTLSGTGTLMNVVAGMCVSACAPI